MELRDERYMLLTTFRRDGRPVATPVWWVELEDGRFGFYTSSASGKAKRLAHTSRVIVQPCNPRGQVKPGSEPVEAQARVVSGAELAAVKERIVRKYGFQTKVTKLLAKLGAAVRRKPYPYADRGVIVTL